MMHPSDSNILGLSIIPSNTKVIEVALAVYHTSPDITAAMVLEKLNSDKI